MCSTNWARHPALGDLLRGHHLRLSRSCLMVQRYIASAGCGTKHGHTDFKCRLGPAAIVQRSLTEPDRALQFVDDFVSRHGRPRARQEFPGVIGMDPDTVRGRLQIGMCT